MSLVEQYRSEAIARRRRLYGDETNYCSRRRIPLIRVGGYSGTVTGKLWNGLNPESSLGSSTRRAIDIIDAVLKVTFVSRNDFMSTRRSRTVAEARQLACFFMRHHTRLSFPQIGGYVGGKDHSTVLHAVRTVNANRDDRFTTRLQAIAMLLQLPPPVEIKVQ